MPDLKTEMQKIQLRKASGPEASAGREKSGSRSRACTPHYTRLLTEKLGLVEASNRLSFHVTSLRAALRNEAVSTIAEIAAKGVLAELEAAENRKRSTSDVFVVYVPAAKKEAFKAMTSAMQIRAFAIHEE